jgi:hypothetical protein
LKTSLGWKLSLPVLLIALAGCAPKPLSTDGYAEVLAAFREPPPEYRSAPLWVWNERVTETAIDEQLADFKAKGIGGVFVHPRPGLITPYLSEEWLRLFRRAVETGKTLGMKVWIYDENSYPSGFAGGHVPALIPDAARTGLRMKRYSLLPAEFPVPPLIILRAAESGFEDVTERAGREDLGPGDYRVFDLNPQKPSPWYGGFTYVDIMRRNVTDTFLDVTLNAYKRAVGPEFGAVVPGSFQDEAEIAPAGGADVVNYTPALFDRFELRWGYDLRLRLPALFEERGDWKRVRHNFYQTLLELVIENWAIPYYEYCTANNLALTGHYWEHEWPVPRVVPDSMALSACAHVPGIDILMNEFRTDPHAQFGNARAVREVRSVANQLGRARILSETYGASGWDLTFFDQKRIGDWEYALGVNLLNQHLSYMTIVGARKRDHPLSFSYHEPWWPHYGLLADYFARLSVVMTMGRQVNRVLLLEPTTTAWMYYSPEGPMARLDEIGRNFQDLVNALETAQIEYDLGAESILESRAEIGGGALKIGECRYELIVLPAGMENLGAGVAGLLDDFLKRGGKVLCLGDPPGLIDGTPSDRMAKLAARHERRWTAAPQAEAVEAIGRHYRQGILFNQDPGGSSFLFHQKRHLKNACLVFLANTSPDRNASGSFVMHGASVEAWDPFTGRVSAWPAERNGDDLQVEYDLPPAGSLLLCVLDRPSPPPAPAGTQPEWKAIPAEGTIQVEALAPNVLTLDFCDLAMAGTTARDLYFYEAQLKTFRQHGLDRNPWDSAVQYKTNIMDKDRFRPDSGFEATFRFRAGRGVDLGSIEAVVERPRLYRVSVNGRTVEPDKDRWWLDKAFGVFAIGRHLAEGENRLTIRARPFTIETELEPVYLLGSFRAVADRHGFRLEPAAPLILGAWADQGRPFYSDRVSYTKAFRIPESAANRTSYKVKLGRWQGALAEIAVDGQQAGTIAFPPYELDLANGLTPGLHEVSVVVCGTLKNLLGPHHNSPPRGMAWPGNFQKSPPGGRPPGSEYDIRPYGLIEDFDLLAGRDR